jgi:hypothetical protein
MRYRYTAAALVALLGFVQAEVTPDTGATCVRPLMICSKLYSN